MTSLLERLTRLSRDLAELRDLRRDSQEAELFATRARATATALQATATLMPVARLLRGRGLDDRVDRTAATNLLGQLRRVASDYSADRKAAMSAEPERTARLWQPLKTYAATLEASLRQAWSAGVSRVFLPPAADLLDTLEPVPGFSEAVAEVRRLVAEAERLRAILPRSGSDLDAPDELAAGLRSAWDVVGAEALGTEVVDFLRAAAIGDARLSQMTPAVAAWIAAHPALGEGLRISLGRDVR